MNTLLPLCSYSKLKYTRLVEVNTFAFMESKPLVPFMMSAVHSSTLTWNKSIKIKQEETNMFEPDYETSICDQCFNICKCPNHSHF